ncbi:MAG: hypothetical protein IBX50_19705 [Marinospirillum sp.]|uniref:DUF5681 domain-containing protein n=1 Tax=Marinospirillum sp. TaxID=2183934 RepID=UPI0019F17842|nr:DUF5681 domain-containing protein [Marinospirillum sp.]MBE0508916.1 hypothetical protein [Marinospirillum sp.]
MTKEKPLRTKDGKFQKGASGNPSGRPRQASSLLREQLRAHGAEVVDRVIEAALQGDMQAAKMVLDRIAPTLKPQSAPVSIELASDAGLAGTAWAFVDAAAAGEMAPDIAGQMVQAVSSLARISEIDELLTRIERLEKKADSGECQW